MTDAKKLMLTIVIPAYNEEDYIGACLEAIASQTEAPDEVLVVDNNSTDRTAEVVAKYSFARVIKESQQGIVFARDRGFNAARGEIIARIDADTLLNPDWCAQLRKFFAVSPVAAVVGSCYFYDYPLRRTLHYAHYAIYQLLQRVICGHHVLWGANMALRREAWETVRTKVDRHDRGHEDVDLSFALHDADLVIKRNRKLRADVSLLRGDLAPRHTRSYLAGWPEAYDIKGHHWRSMPIRFMQYFILGLSHLITFIGHPKQRVHQKPTARR
jgi:glycosyltransferase involved in cell wall biosynthesis